MTGAVNSFYMTPQVFYGILGNLPSAKIVSQSSVNLIMITLKSYTFSIMLFYKWLKKKPGQFFNLFSQ